MLFSGYIGAKHTNENNIPKGFPRSEWGKIREKLKELERKGIFIVKPTHYGKELSLNPRMEEQIKETLAGC